MNDANIVLRRYGLAILHMKKMRGSQAEHGLTVWAQMLFWGALTGARCSDHENPTLFYFGWDQLCSNVGTVKSDHKLNKGCWHTGTSSEDDCQEGKSTRNQLLWGMVKWLDTFSLQKTGRSENMTTIFRCHKENKWTCSLSPRRAEPKAEGWKYRKVV